MSAPRRLMPEDEIVRLFIKGNTLMGVTLRAYGQRLAWMTTDEGQAARSRVEAMVRRAMKRALRRGGRDA